MHGNNDNKQPNPKVKLLLGYFVGVMRFLIRSLLRNITSCVTRLTCFGQEKLAFHFFFRNTFLVFQVKEMLLVWTTK